MPPNKFRPATIAATSEIGNDPAYGAVTPPLYLSTTYKFKALDEIGEFDYGRSGNFNRGALARTVAKMEHGSGGVVCSSGLAAIDLTLNLLPPNALIIAPHDLYGGTHRLFLARQKQGRLRVKFIDQSDSSVVESAMNDAPHMLFIETPSNPLMRLVDIKSLAKKGKTVGALVVCDNTFLSPARQNPLLLGADISVHSSTKYINGHSDVVGGITIAKTAQMAEELAWWSNCTGVNGAPFDSFLTLRGLRTLHARMDVQEKNAGIIAAFLQSHDKIKHVYYPGLKSDPGHTLGLRQQSGPGAMLSFELDTPRAALDGFFKAAEIFQFAESLGGTESLICHPASMTHRAMDAEARARAGIRETLVRLSVGLEDSQDQITELKSMLASV